MPFPATRRQLATQGYQWLNFAKCAGCGASVSWYKTPKGASIPMDPMANDESPAISHWATCPKAKQFRRGK